MPRPSYETIATVRALRAKGHSISEIVAKTGLFRSVVHRHCRDVCMPFGPLKPGRKRKVTSTTCRELKSQGLTYRAIAARVGCALSAVHRAIHS